jgi:peptidoglycan/LPS O-acetylase OafA/YrhL
LIALAAFVLVARVGARGGAFNDLSAAHWMARQVLYALAAVGFVLPAVFGETTRGWPRRVLANRVLLYLGLISYGIYLWHLGVMLKLADLGYGDNTLVHPYLHWIVGGFVVTVAIASLSWFVVERPALSLKRLVGGSPRDPAPPGEALAEPARPVVRS